MTIHELAHNSAREILIPYVAISDNINIHIGDIVITADFKEMEITHIRYMNALSIEGNNKIHELYNIDTMLYLRLWYKRFQMFSSLYLIFAPGIFSTALYIVFKILNIKHSVSLNSLPSSAVL